MYASIKVLNPCKYEKYIYFYFNSVFIPEMVWTLSKLISEREVHLIEYAPW